MLNILHSTVLVTSIYISIKCIFSMKNRTVNNHRSFVFYSYNATAMPIKHHISTSGKKTINRFQSSEDRFSCFIQNTFTPFSEPSSPLMKRKTYFLFQGRFQPSVMRNSILHYHTIFDIKVFVFLYLLGLQGMVGVMLTSGNKILLSLILSKA